MAGPTEAKDFVGWLRGPVLPWLLGGAFLIAGYQYYYATLTAIPGNDPAFPLGWWGWFDQGHYLRSARALLHGDFRPSEHYYPPLYPLLGALSLPVSEMHAYYAPDLLLMLGFFVVFVQLFGRYVGAWGAAACALLGMTLYWEFRLQWIIPWTSTPSAFFTICALSLFERYARERTQLVWTRQRALLNAALFGLVIGLQLANRPADLIIMVPVAICYAALVVIGLLRGSSIGRDRDVLALTGGAAGLAVPLLGFLLFNLVTYGTLAGGYVGATMSDSIAPSTLFTRLYSLLLASQTYFGEQNADWLSVIPIVLTAVLFLPATLLAGPVVFRVAAAAAIGQLIVYGSYVDLLPTGMFRFGNIHYFKWLAPIAIVTVFYWMRALVLRRGVARRAAALVVVATVLVILLVLSITTRSWPMRPSHLEVADRTLAFDVDGSEIDYIDLAGIRGGWSEVYFDFQSIVTLDGGHRLRPVKDYRFLPIDSGVRLLFLPPVRPEHIELQLAQKVTIVPDMSLSEIQPVDVSFAIGLPLSQQSSPPHPPPGYILGELIDLSPDGRAGRYLGHGWSVSEPWGRWIDGSQATLQMNVGKRRSGDLELSLSLAGFTPAFDAGDVGVSVYVNGHRVGRATASKEGRVERSLRVPSRFIEPNGTLRIRLVNLTTVSPREAGMNDDTRQLGVGLSSLRLERR